MAKEIFPRLRSKDFAYVDTFSVPSYQTGRLDLICSERYAEPRTYKVLAAANGIVDTMTNRPGIRPATEALENELVLRGVKPKDAPQAAKEIDDIRVLGMMDWKSYGNVTDGNITDVDHGRIMFVPSPDTAVAWFEKYNTLQEEDED